MSLDEMFGTLRALLDGGLQYESQRAYFLHFLEQAHAQDAARYQSQWAPYLSGLRLSWPDPFLRVSTIPKLRLYTTLLPCVRFELSLKRRMLSQEELDALADEALSSSVSSLALWGRGDDTTDHKRQAALSFKRLNRLGLSMMEVNKTQVSAYLKMSRYPALEHLDLHAGKLDDNFLAMLEASAYAGRVHRLGLGATKVTGQGLSALMTSARVPRISWINMASTAITPAQLKVMAASGRLQDAEYVQLSNCKVGDEGAAALSSSSALTRLGHLDLVGTGLTTKGLTALLHTELGAGLRSFNVSSNSSVELASALAQAPALPLLEKLYHHGPLEPDAISLFRQSRALSQLRSLDLWTSGIELTQLHQLVEAPWFGQLEELGLAFQRFDAQGWRWLLMQPQLKSLKVLKLWGVTLDDAWVKVFTQSPHLSNLEHLEGLDLKALSAASRKRWAAAPYLKAHLKHMILEPAEDDL